LAGGDLINPKNEKAKRIFNTLNEIAGELDIDALEKIVYCWLIQHPASIIPIVGTGNIERIKYAVEALNLNMSLEQWFKIYNAAAGRDLP